MFAICFYVISTYALSFLLSDFVNVPFTNPENNAVDILSLLQKQKYEIVVVNGESDLRSLRKKSDI